MPAEKMLMMTDLVVVVAIAFSDCSHYQVLAAAQIIASGNFPVCCCADQVQNPHVAQY